MPVRPWKPLLLIVPAGLMLGALGGHYARPVISQRADDGSLQSVFETRAQRYGTATPAQPEDATYYSGQYSYPPYLDDRMGGDDRDATGWQGPSFADWPEYKPAPLPSAEQLEAQLAARDSALGQRAGYGPGAGTDDQSAVQAPGDAAADDATNAADEARSSDTAEQDAGAAPKVVLFSPPDPPAAPSTEPRTADGNLPAIW